MTSAELARLLPTGRATDASSARGSVSKADTARLFAAALKEARGYAAAGAPTSDAASFSSSADSTTLGQPAGSSAELLKLLLGRESAQSSAASASAPESAGTMSGLPGIDGQYGGLVQDAAARSGVEPALINAVIKTESAFNPKAVSSAGAKGLMQLMDGTARGLGVTDSFDPRQNVLGGAKLLRQLLDRYSGDVTLALAAYNAGPGAVDAHGGVPPFAETQAYVKRVGEALAAYRSRSSNPADS